jgi:hypothetical protein
VKQLPALSRRTRDTAHAMSVAIALLLFSSPSMASQVTVKRQDYGEKWPFPSHATATIDCKWFVRYGQVNSGPVRATRQMVIIKLGTKWYGLNGPAMGVGEYPDARTQMARDPMTEAYLLGASHEFIKMGLAICGDEP